MGCPQLTLPDNGTVAVLSCYSGMKIKRIWTESEIARLIELVRSGASPTAAGLELTRSPRAVQFKARELGETFRGHALSSDREPARSHADEAAN